MIYSRPTIAHDDFLHANCDTRITEFAQIEGGKSNGESEAQADMAGLGILAFAEEEKMGKGD
jgi:hypothetical protein